MKSYRHVVEAQVLEATEQCRAFIGAEDQALVVAVCEAGRVPSALERFEVGDVSMGLTIHLASHSFLACRVRRKQRRGRKQGFHRDPSIAQDIRDSFDLLFGGQLSSFRFDSALGLGYMCSAGKCQATAAHSSPCSG